MGVKGLFSWVQHKFPATVATVPSGFNTKNLYIDLNGPIHDVMGSAFQERFRTEDPYFQNNTLTDLDRFQRSADRIRFFVHALQPKELLYLAVDGVAPVAKVAEQRGRRLSKAVFASLSKENEEKTRKLLLSYGCEVPPEMDLESWDRTNISVGTSFMKNLSAYLQEFLEKEKKENELFASIDIKFSDHSIPGEGEHKIASYIRSLPIVDKHNRDIKRTFQNKMVVETKCDHLIVSDDGDLFFIGLALQQPNIFVVHNEQKRKLQIARNTGDIKLQLGYLNKKKSLEIAEKAGLVTEFDVELFKHELLSLDLVKSSLQYYFADMNDVGGDVQRAANDLILLSCFLGNDFIPGVPHVIIKKDFDQLVQAYTQFLTKSEVSVSLKQTANSFTGDLAQLEQKLTNKDVTEETDYPYLTSKDGDINYENLKEYLSTISISSKQDLSKHNENKRIFSGIKEKRKVEQVGIKRTFLIRTFISQYFLHNKLNKELLDESVTVEQYDTEANRNLKFTSTDVGLLNIIEEFGHRNNLITKHIGDFVEISSTDMDTKIIAKIFMSEYLYHVSRLNDHFIPEHFYNPNEFDNKNFEDEDTYKSEYYKVRCKTEDSDDVVANYLKTVQFILKYYITGLPSWNHSYKYLNSPFFSDILSYIKRNKGNIDSTFEISKPNQPLSQLSLFVGKTGDDKLPSSLIENVHTKYIEDNVSEKQFYRDGSTLSYRYKFDIPVINGEELFSVDKILSDSKESLTQEEVERNKLTEEPYYYKGIPSLQTKTNPFSFQLQNLPHREMNTHRAGVKAKIKELKKNYYSTGARGLTTLLRRIR